MSTLTQQKALFLPTKQGEFAIGLRDVPKPGAGDILVKNVAVGLNPVDWKIQAFGLFVEKYPTILGIDAAGVVEAVGEGVTSLKKGDRVLYSGFLDNDRATYQEYTLIVADLAAKIPEKLSFDQAATVPLAIATASIGLYHPHGATKFVAPWVDGGNSKCSGTPLVVIGGSSVVGSLAIQLAKLSGFSPIITTASLKNTELLKSYGATHVLDRNLSADALRAEVTKVAGGRVATVYDPISSPDTQSAAYGLLAPEGRLLVVLPEAVKETSEGRTVSQVHGIVHFPHNLDFGKALYRALPGLLESGEIKPVNVEVVTGGLGGITAGLEKLKTNQVSASKLVIHPSETV
ncbi:GroES-like protein [Lentinus tigrinus ALCF2SS1-7]|uniref:GroES-like protein n=1 Tax=Lentinus tigrinus ALCF2SS1-7 TaxID=1328758 RepID=UPI001165CD30|nr:GroES-like protein [Lentinus tigrinus ALCF2SS1-7]